MAKPDNDESKLIQLLSKIVGEHFKTTHQLLSGIARAIGKHERNSATQHHEIEGKIMALSDDLNDAVAQILAKNDALIDLVNQLVAAAAGNKDLPEAVTKAIAALKAEADKDDVVLNPPPPTT